ncbi:MAG: hypothetical protein WD470_10330 [Rhodospirillaceae bacterium]
MTDYWVNKLVFDLQGPDGKDRWTNHREEVIAQYPISPELREAMLTNDIGALLPHMNPYLMRFYLLVSGYGDKESIEVLNGFQTEEERERVNG